MGLERKNSRKRIQAEQPEAIWAKLTSDVVTDRKSMLRACVLNKDTYSEQGRRYKSNSNTILFVSLCVD